MASLGFNQLRVKSSITELRTSRRPGLTRSSRVGFRVLAAESQSEPDLSVTVNGLKMPNPFVIGSGPPGTNYTVMKRAFDEGWGAVIAKTDLGTRRTLGIGRNIGGFTTSTWIHPLLSPHLVHPLLVMFSAGTGD